MLLTLRIKLAYIKNPPVWRKLMVPAQFNFHQLHLLIQAAFGWENYHMYLFSENGHVSDVKISEPFDEDWQDVIDSREITIGSVLNTIKQKLQYIYDFGDDWLHIITVEKIEDTEATNADCIAGKGACPPEDCGGPWGYEALKEKLANPLDPEHEEMKEWLGMEEDDEWDADNFDLEVTKKMVRHV
jgi:hypothetical protein